MEPSKPDNSSGESSTEKKIKRTNPAKLIAMGFMRKDLIANEVAKLSQDPKMAKVPLRNPIVPTATATAAAPAIKPIQGEGAKIKYPNVLYVAPGTQTGIFKKRTRASLSAIREDTKGETDAADEKDKDDANATI